MPCTDGGVPYPPTREEIIAAKMPAVLCGLVSKLGVDAVVDAVDWVEAGVTPAEFVEWWTVHERNDRMRRQREARQREQEALRAQALAKLSPAERAALGQK